MRTMLFVLLAAVLTLSAGCKHQRTGEELQKQLQEQKHMRVSDFSSDDSFTTFSDVQHLVGLDMGVVVVMRWSDRCLFTVFVVPYRNILYGAEVKVTEVVYMRCRTAPRASTLFIK
ncbi:MAG: hypothetical protein WC528_02900 [Patescibacteria group bacterium]